MTKLNQIVAVVNGKKTETQRALTELHRAATDVDGHNGLSREYKPLDDNDTEFLPPEQKLVRRRAKDSLSELREVLSPLLDVVATQDVANCQAKADIVVGDEVVLQNVPVTHLLFLEKQLNDIDTFVSKLPVLDAGETWKYDPNVDCYATEAYQTNRSRKTLQSKVLYEATENHPAQVETYNEDVVVGRWTNRKFSGALTQHDKNLMVQRVKSLKDAVKYAREQANLMEVEQQRFAENVFDFIIG